MFAVTKILIIVGLGLVLVLAAVSCVSKDSADDTASADNSATAGSTSSAMLPLPPDSLVQLNSMTEAGREISMEANLWYNLMPGPEEESVPELNIQARLMTEEKSTVPGDYVLDYVWVSMGGGTWGIPPEQDQIGSGAVRERMFRVVRSTISRMGRGKRNCRSRRLPFASWTRPAGSFTCARPISRSSGFTKLIVGVGAGRRRPTRSSMARQSRRLPL